MLSVAVGRTILRKTIALLLLHRRSTTNACSLTSRTSSTLTISRRIILTFFLLIVSICGFFLHSNLVLSSSGNGTDLRPVQVTQFHNSDDDSQVTDADLNMASDVNVANRNVKHFEGEKPKSASWTILFSFTNHAHILPLSIATILAIASGVVIPALAFFLGQIFNCFSKYGSDQLTGRELTQKTTHYCAYLAGLGSASWLLNGGYFMFWILFGELQARSMRNRVYQAMLDKDLEWFDTHKDGMGALIPRLQT